MKKIIPEGSVLVPDQAKLAFKGMIFDVYQWPQTLFDGSEHTFEMLKRPDTVTALGVVNDKVLIIDDEQPHLGSRKSFPGGRVDETDASTQAAIQREVREETGYSFKNWRLIKVSQPFRKFEWFVYVWLAWEVTDLQQPSLDPGEKITLAKVGFDELKRLIMTDTDYLGESRSLFENIGSLPDLLAVPAFAGQEVER